MYSIDKHYKYNIYIYIIFTHIFAISMSIEVSDTKIDLSIDAVLHSYKGDGTLLETTENVDWTMSGNEKASRSADQSCSASKGPYAPELNLSNGRDG